MSPTRLPRVLLVSGAFPHMPCGVGDYTDRLAHALAVLPGIRTVDVLTSADPWVDVHSPRRNGVRVWPAMPGWGLGEAKTLTSFVRMLRPDVVHVQSPSHMGRSDRAALSTLIPAVLRTLLPRPYLVTTIHELSERRARFRLRVYPELLASDALIFTSEADARAAHAFPIVRNRLSRVIPIGPNLIPSREGRERREEVRRALGMGQDEPLLVQFGFFLPDKGIEVALEALSLLRARGVAARLLLLGRPTAETKDYWLRKLSPRIARLPEPSCVVVRDGGHPDQTSACLLASDIAVFPFRGGASARRGSLLAAMAHGLPTVTTRGPRLPDGIVDGVNVLLVEPGDAEGLAASIARLSADPSLGARLGEAGRARALSPSWEEIAKATLEVYGG